MIDWVVESFAKQHERTDFSCGKPALDDFIRSRVSQYEKRRLGKTFVLVPSGGKRVVGYFTLAAGAVSFSNLPADASRKLPQHPVPVVLLARLAVDQSVQGNRLGERLLLDALHRTAELSSRLGIYALEVDALDAAATAFHVKYGFVPLLDDPRHLFLPITTIEGVFG